MPPLVAVRMICNRDDPTTTNRKNASSTGPTVKGDCFFYSERGAGADTGNKLRRGGQLRGKSRLAQRHHARARPNRPRSSRRGPYQRARTADKLAGTSPRLRMFAAKRSFFAAMQRLDLVCAEHSRWYAAAATQADAGSAQQRLAARRTRAGAAPHGMAPPAPPLGESGGRASSNSQHPLWPPAPLTLPNTHSITHTHTHGGRERGGKGDARGGGGRGVYLRLPTY